MGSEARTRLALAALLVVTLFSFGQVFARGEYPGPALLGMFVAGVIAAGARRMGMSTLLTGLVSAAGLTTYVALVFQGRHTLYGLPTVEAVRGVVESLQRAYDASLIDYAPVPVRPGYIVGMVVAMWIATTLGEIATFRWRRPLIAAAPTIALFAFLAIVGTRAGTTLLVLTYIAALLTFLATESSHRLRAWGRWVTGIGGEGAGEATAVSSSLARRMGVSCLAAALIAPAFLPALGDGLLSWRSGSGNGGSGFGTGGGSSGEIDLLASLKPTLIERSGEELFRISAPRPTYWRLASLVAFDGVSWRPEQNPNRFLATGGQIAAEGRVVRNEPLEQQVTITGLRGEALPAAVQPVSIEITDDPAGRTASGEVFFEHTTGGLTIRDGVTEGLAYTVGSQEADLSFADLQSAEVATADDLYTSTPPLSEPVLALRDRWVAGADTPAEILLALQRRLRNFSYSLDVEPLADEDYLEQFLLDTRVGYCQQFSAAFALLARSLGFPTRVSIGFLPGETNISRPDDYIVRGTHAHSWPEVLFKNYGWVRFEPTPGNQATPPRYTLPPSAAPGIEDPFAPGGGADGNPLNLEGNQNVPTGGRDRGGEVPGSRQDPRSPIYEWQETFSSLLKVLLIAAFLFIGSVPLIKTIRSALLYRRAKTPGAQTTAAFRHFEIEAAELAATRSPAESASGFARRLGARHKVPKKPAARLAAIYELATYGPGPLPPDAAHDALEQSRALRRALWSGATWWQRLTRLFSPVSLLGR